MPGSFSSLAVTVGPVPSTSQASQQMPVVSGLNPASTAVTSSSATQEYRKLFAPRKNSFVRESNPWCGKGKGIPSCTLKFFCLSRVATTKPPTGIRERENYIVKCCPGWCQHPISNGCHQVGIPSGNRVQVSETTQNRVWIVALTARWRCGVLQHPFPSHSTTHKGCCWKCQDIYTAPT